MSIMHRRIVFFTKYTTKGPSSRYRTFQYLPYYKDNYKIKVHPFFSDHYLDRLFNNKPIYKGYLVIRLILRIYTVLFKVSKKDVVFIEYELVPYFPPILEHYLKFRGIQFILDYDDAIFHNYDQSKYLVVRRFLGNKIPTIIRIANHIVTGSPYLTAFAEKYNKYVTEIPTSISIHKYSIENVQDKKDKVFNIGWVGSKTTSKNIISILESLKDITSAFQYKLSLIGFDSTLIPMLEGIPFVIINWDEVTEPLEISKFDVGIMPLDDNLFNRGKCGFKLVQYMASGIPTISSPLVTNLKINRSGKNLHASGISDWKDAFLEVYQNLDYFREVGKENYNDFKKYYSVETNVAVYLSIFNKI